MKEKPIPFSGPMVQAILGGRKTQTRRVVKLQHIKCYKGAYSQPCTKGYVFNTAANSLYCSECGNIVEYSPEGKDYCRTIDCPYPLGTRLWVRETWADNIPGCPNGITYRADHIDPKGDGPANPIKWKPSIYMPKEIARIWLEVVSVRVERVQEITEEDARAEGCIDFHDKIGDGKFDDVAEFDLTARDAFAELWDSLNAKRGYGWDANPWVWVVEFKVVEQ